MNLTEKKCVPCEGGAPPMGDREVAQYLKEVPDWRRAEETKKITRSFTFADFKEAMDFVNKIAGLAEEEGHHPDICIFYHIVELELWTHAVGGLSENDFILAAKIDRIAKGE